MDQQKIIEQLSKFIPPRLCEELKLTSSLDGISSIVMCMTVNDIIRQYKSTEDEENQVSLLLAELCKQHFSKFDIQKAA